MTEIKILGTGCKKCVQLKHNTEEAVKQLGIDADIQKVENINDIVAYGVMATPALVIDGKVKFMGKVATTEEIKSAFGK